MLAHVHGAGERGEQDAALDAEVGRGDQAGGAAQAVAEKPQACGVWLSGPTDFTQGEWDGGLEIFADAVGRGISLAIAVAREIH